MNSKPPIPLVELVSHYHEFKSKRDEHGALLPGPYRSQKARIALADTYIAEPQKLIDKFQRSVTAFASYSNLVEPFIGRSRVLASRSVTVEAGSAITIDQITSGPKAASYLYAIRDTGPISIEGLGDYLYVDREIRPARTTAASVATMANRFDDEKATRSTSAMSADLLLRSQPDGRPTVGELKLSTSRGDDADPVYAVIQALALASQLASSSQRARLLQHYSTEDFAPGGPLDIVVFLFLLGESNRTKTNRKTLLDRAAELCSKLDHGPLQPWVDRAAVVAVTRSENKLQFTRN